MSVSKLANGFVFNFSVPYSISVQIASKVLCFFSSPYFLLLNTIDSGNDMAFSNKMRHEISYIYICVVIFFFSLQKLFACVQISIQNEQIRHTELVFVSFDL